ncbi:hypothetical protein [Rhodococcus sp. USK13]|uniref:hypothetical protein n=1 Tax=Rhodococcus sp. USK13 TaxID=2806442 RepID=UPI001BCB93C5|nr:hypothetical protein [Rhodococcus sp. USK13]
MNFDAIDRPAVLKALAKCDESSRDEFLKEFGFNRALKYEVVHDGKRYDSKAIVGVAHGYATGIFLRPHQFSGGRKVTSRLEELGFEIAGVSAPH